MSPIPSIGSKFSKMFKSKKDAAPAATSTAPQAPAPAASFDAATPLSKNFRKLSVQVDNGQNAMPAKPAKAAKPTRIGLPPIDEVATTRGHAAPSNEPKFPTNRPLTPKEIAALSRSDREKYVEHEISLECAPLHPYVVLGEVLPPEGYNVQVPKSPGTPTKSILKKESFINQLPRLDEKAPLKTPQRKSTTSSVSSSNGLDGGRLSRTVSFDHHTEEQQKRRELLKEERDITAAYYRNIERQKHLASRRETL